MAQHSVTALRPFVDAIRFGTLVFEIFVRRLVRPREGLCLMHFTNYKDYEIGCIHKYRSKVTSSMRARLRAV